MQPLPLVRAAHLNTYSAALQDIGAPVHRELARAGLPADAEEHAGAFLSLPHVLSFVSSASKDLEINDFGYHAARHTSTDDLSADMQLALVNAPSGLERLRSFIRFAVMENTALNCEIRREANALRVICDLTGFRDHAAIAAPEWIAVCAMVNTVRSFAGPDWSPKEITLMTAPQKRTRAFEEFPQARIHYGTAHSSITLPLDLAVSPIPKSDAEVTDVSHVAHTQMDFVASVKEVLRPYLADPGFSIDSAAEIAGQSRRTFQRRLANHNKSFSRLMQEVKYEQACRLLVAEGSKVIEVAMIVGFEHPQHFARAFRDMSGVSPKEYRRLHRHRQ